jgi:hypothetical protein
MEQEEKVLPDAEFCKAAANLYPELDHIIYDAIEKGKFPHYLKVYPKNSYLRRTIHVHMEKLRVESVTDKEHPFYFFRYQGWESFDIKNFLCFPMVLTITVDSLKPTLKYPKSSTTKITASDDSAIPILAGPETIDDLYNLLPEPVLYCIFSQLSWSDVYACFLTCRDWSLMSDSPLLWQLKWSMIVEQKTMEPEGMRKKGPLQGKGKLNISLNTTAPLRSKKNTSCDDEIEKITDYKSLVRSEIFNKLCCCRPGLKHKHFSSYPPPEPCYIACHGSLLSNLRHTIDIYRRRGYTGEIMYNPDKMADCYYY